MTIHCSFCGLEKKDTSCGLATTEKFQAPIICSECVKMFNAVFARQMSIDDFRFIAR